MKTDILLPLNTKKKNNSPMSRTYDVASLVTHQSVHSALIVDNVPMYRTFDVDGY